MVCIAVINIKKPSGVIILLAASVILVPFSNKFKYTWYVTNVPSKPQLQFRTILSLRRANKFLLRNVSSRWFFFSSNWSTFKKFSFLRHWSRTLPIFLQPLFHILDPQDFFFLHFVRYLRADQFFITMSIPLCNRRGKNDWSTQRKNLISSQVYNYNIFIERDSNL